MRRLLDSHSALRRLRLSEGLSFLLLGTVSLGLWGLFSLVNV